MAGYKIIENTSSSTLTPKRLINDYCAKPVQLKIAQPSCELYKKRYICTRLNAKKN